MTKPPNMDDAVSRHMLAEYGEGIHTFSNGTDWECWADGNCYQCAYWDADTMGAACAFEGAAFLDLVAPELAQLFGWIQRETKYGPRSGWDAPDSCRFFRNRTNDDGTDYIPPPEPDPRQLVLFADPTEDAALIRETPTRERAYAI